MMPKSLVKKFKYEHYGIYPNDVDEKILSLLQTVKKPLTSFSIALLLGIDQSRCCKRLKSLEKSGHLKIITRKKMSFWTINKKFI